MKTTDFTDSAIIKKFETYPLSHHVILRPQFLKFIGRVSGQKILDLGCGSGTVTADLVRKRSHCIGVDPSRPFIEAAQKKFPLIKFYVGKGSHLNMFNDRTFDKVVMRNVLLNVPSARELNGIFREVSRVLKRGGELIFSVLHPLVIRNFNDKVRSVKLPPGAHYFKSGMVFKNRMLLNDFTFIPFTPVHWTLEDISRALERNKFIITALREPRLIEDEYRKILKDTLVTPHYLLIKSQLMGKRP